MKKTLLLLVLLSSPLSAQMRHVITDAGSTVSCSNCSAGGTTVLSADGTANPTIGQQSAFGMMFNGTTWDRVRGSIAAGILVNLSNASVAVTQATGTNLHVVCDSGCGSSATVLMADTVANPTIPQSAAFGVLYNGTTWDRWRGSIAAGALVNVSNASLAVTGTFWQATQPVSIAATVATSSTQLPAALDGSGFFKVHEQGTAAVSIAGTVAVSMATNTPDVTDRAARLLGHTVTDTGSTTAVTGNVTVVQPTGSNLHIACDSGCGGAASFTDNGAFTFGTTSVNNMGAVVDDVATNSVTENSSGTPRMSTSRILYVDNSKGGSLPAGTNVIGHVIADTGSTTAVTGTVATSMATNTPDVTDRAARLLGHVVADTGSTTAVTGNVAVTNAGLTNIDVALSTRTKPADQQHAIIDSGTTTVTQATGTNLHVVVDTAPTTAVTGTFWQATQPVSGTFWQATQPISGTVTVSSAPTTAVTGTFWQATQPVSLSANQSVNVAQMAGTATSMNAGVSDAGTIRVEQAQELTYSAGLTIKTATAAGTGPFFSLCGSASKTVSVQRLFISGTVATAAVWGDIILKRTSTATSGGTATTLTVLPMDSNNAAGSAVAKYYTVLGTAGTSAGVVDAQTSLFPVTVISATLQPTPIPLIWRWRDQDSQPPTLRGVAQCMEANFGTTTTNAPTLTVGVTWTEK